MIQTNTLLNQVSAGLDFGENWYRRANSGCSEIADILGVSLNHFVFSAAVFSPRVHILRSIKMAIQFCLNPERRPISSLSLSYSLARKYASGGQLAGKKTEAFRRSIMSSGLCGSLCLDVWSCRGLRVEQSKVYNVSIFPRVERLFHRVSQSTGLCLPQLQACQWYASMVEHGRNVNGFDLITPELLEYAKLSKMGELS